MKRVILLFFILSLSISLFLTGCKIRSTNKQIPEAVNGVLDLSTWDFNRDGPVQLNGKWEFYWNQLFKPEDFTLLQKNNPSGYIQIPGKWNKQKIGNTDYPPAGCATIRLTILHKPTEKLLGIMTKEINTSSALYIDNMLLISSGQVSNRQSGYIPDILPQNASFLTHSDRFTITLNMSNYLDKVGGSDSITLGYNPQILKLKNRNLAIDLLLFSSFLIMGLYHLTLFLLRRKDKSTLYFGIFTLVFALRTALMGERVLHQFLWFLGYKYLIIMEILIIPVAVVSFAYYFSTFFPTRSLTYVNRVFLIVSSLFFSVSLFLPLAIVTDLLYVYLSITLVMAGFLVYILIRSIQNKVKYARLFAAGFLILFISLLNDILFFFKIIQTGWIFPLGLFLFIFFQAFLLSKKFTKAFYAVENLSNKLSALDKLKDTFLMNTTHQLKNPLLGMMGLAETLLDGDAGPINEVQARNLSLINASGRRLLHQVNDLLDFSRIKKKEVEIEKQPVDIKEICDIVFVFSRPFLVNKDIVLLNRISDNFPLVSGDVGRLQQIMHNLIGNAIKYTQSGEVVVSAKQKGEMAYISIKDTGTGIPEDKLDYIFESFEQIGLSETSKGTGIGLSITKQLIELHGGKITAESTLGVGSIFTFSMPVSSKQKKTEETEILSLHSHDVAELDAIQDYESQKEMDVKNIEENRQQILLADDDPDFHKVIEEYLVENQFYLVSAMNGLDALQKIHVEKFDLLLLDLMMPGMSGYLLCKEIRKQYDTNELPIIFITEKNVISDIIEGLKAGANDYISKPVKKSELIARIKTHIQLSQLSKAYSRFIPKDFLQLLGRDSIIDVGLGDQVQREMTILFCDIRSFMSLSENMTPKENFNFLNSYFEKIAPIIRKHHGYIDKYMGDGMMAIFPGHPEDALRSALEIKRAITIYNSFRTKVGYKPISVGIGLHTGPIMLGTIGDETRMEGTVISDTVNVASRLEGLTKLYGGSIIISLNIFLALNDPSMYFYRFLGQAQVKGKRDAVPIYEVFDTSDTDQKKLKTKDTFERALQAYLSKEFKQAEEYLTIVCELDPYDKAARLFLNRAKENQATELPEYWDGVEKINFK